MGEALQPDATSLLDRAAFDGEQIPCAAVDASVRFRDARARAAVMDEYLTALKPLRKKHGSRTGEKLRRAGDLILQLAGASVVSVRDLSILVGGPLRTGTQADARYLRGDQMLTGSGTI